MIRLEIEDFKTIEVSVNWKDIFSQIGFDVTSEDGLIRAFNEYANFLTAIDDSFIQKMLPVQKQMVRNFLLDQAVRFKIKQEDVND